MRLSTKIQLTLLDNLVWVLLAVFFLVNTLFTPNFFSGKNQLNILYQSATLGLLVLGQGIVMMVGELDLSMEATLAFAPGVTILLARQLGLGPVVSILLTLAVGLAIGWFNGFCVAKLQTNSFLLTMSTQIVMRGLVLFLVPFSLAGLDSTYTFLGRGRIGTIQVAIPALLVVYVIFEFIFRKTIFGRRFTLTGGNRRAAYISGVNTDRVMILAFVLAGLLSAVAGLITAGRQNAVQRPFDAGHPPDAGVIVAEDKRIAQVVRVEAFFGGKTVLRQLGPMHQIIADGMGNQLHRPPALCEVRVVCRVEDVKTTFRTQDAAGEDIEVRIVD